MERLYIHGELHSWAEGEVFRIEIFENDNNVSFIIISMISCNCRYELMNQKRLSRHFELDYNVSSL